METLNATTARREIFHLLDQVNTHHHPIQIQGKLNAAVLIGQEDWNAIQETLHLLSIPGMRESILEGIRLPITQCSDQIEW